MVEVKHYEFHGEEAGPTSVYLGGVHGDEPCGQVAGAEAVVDFQTGKRKVLRGRVIIVPEANPEACRLGVMNIDRNLNRMMGYKDNPVTYEDHVANALCPIMDQADFLTDLHSLTKGGKAYALLKGATRAEDLPDIADVIYGAHLGLPDMLHGWARAYQEGGYQLDPIENRGTTEYARLNGRTISLTVECGKDGSEESFEVARQVMRNSMGYLGLTNDPVADPTQTRLYSITYSKFKQSEGELAQDWQNLQPVAKGTVIGRYADGTVECMPHDGFILLIKPHSTPGTEWFALAAEQDMTGLLQMHKPAGSAIWRPSRPRL